VIAELLVQAFSADALLAGGYEFVLCCPACDSRRRRWRGAWFGTKDCLFACSDCGQVYLPRRRHRPGQSRRT
jgi:hypothetical protein